MNSPAAHARRSALKTAAFIFAAVFLALALAEALFRLAGWGVRHEEAMYTDLNDVAYHLLPRAENPCPGLIDRINGQGTRGPDFATEKPAGVKRVLCLGDSTTFGWGVEADQTYPAHLQRILDESRVGRFEVINGGIPGTNTYQHILFYESIARRWRPDVVIWRDGPNSRYDVQRHRRLSHSQDGRALLWTQRLISHLRIYRSLRNAIRDSRPPRFLAGEGPEEGRIFMGAYLEDLQKIEMLSRRDGFVPIWLSVPMAEQVESCQRDKGECAVAQNAEIITFTDLVKDFTARHGYLYVEPLQAFAEHPIDGDLFVDPSHPGPLGQRLCAQAVYDAMLRAGIIVPEG